MAVCPSTLPTPSLPRAQVRWQSTSVPQVSLGVKRGVLHVSHDLELECICSDWVPRIWLELPAQHRVHGGQGVHGVFYSNITTTLSPKPGTSEFVQLMPQQQPNSDLTHLAFSPAAAVAHVTLCLGEDAPLAPWPRAAQPASLAQDTSSWSGEGGGAIWLLACAAAAEWSLISYQ